MHYESMKSICQFNKIKKFIYIFKDKPTFTVLKTMINRSIDEYGIWDNGSMGPHNSHIATIASPHLHPSSLPFNTLPYSNIFKQSYIIKNKKKH